ncbi:flavin reductase family protein [Rhizobium sp.]|uniref:flavin reductase family protein n=1 Tax=Rhizobium sp. TaxID=391 RepID=UPI000E92011F|nr:flavin reductase [Rhizobium sp.]
MDEQRRLRHALGEFATGVVVVTANTQSDEPVGMTMSSFNSVSLDPPLVLFSIGCQSNSLPAFKAAESYAINVLASEQEDISNRFARALSDKWAGLSFVRGLGGAPLLPGALAHFECLPYAQIEGGDHMIFLARVEKFAARQDSVTPLLFMRGAYHRICNN